MFIYFSSKRILKNVEEIQKHTPEWARVVLASILGLDKGKGAKISAGHREELLHSRWKTHPTGLYKVYELSLPGNLGEEILGIHNHNPGISNWGQQLFRNFPALRFSVRGKMSNVSFFTLYTTLHFVHLNFNLKGLESQSLILKDNVTFVSRVLLFC